MSISQIAEGWFNSFLAKVDLLSDSTKAVGAARAAICKNCPVRTGDICDREKTHKNAHKEPFSGCGCYIEQKVLCLSCTCPGLFW